LLEQLQHQALSAASRGSGGGSFIEVRSYRRFRIGGDGARLARTYGLFAEHAATASSTGTVGGNAEHFQSSLLQLAEPANSTFKDCEYSSIVMVRMTRPVIPNGLYFDGRCTGTGPRHRRARGSCRVIKKRQPRSGIKTSMPPGTWVMHASSTSTRLRRRLIPQNPRRTRSLRHGRKDSHVGSCRSAIMPRA